METYNFVYNAIHYILHIKVTLTDFVIKFPVYALFLLDFTFRDRVTANTISLRIGCVHFVRDTNTKHTHAHKHTQRASQKKDVDYSAFYETI